MTSASRSKVIGTPARRSHQRPVCGQCRIEFGDEQALENRSTQVIRYLGQWVCRIHHLGDKETVMPRRQRRAVERAARKVT